MAASDCWTWGWIWSNFGSHHVWSSAGLTVDRGSAWVNLSPRLTISHVVSRPGCTGSGVQCWDPSLRFSLSEMNWNDSSCVQRPYLSEISRGSKSWSHIASFGGLMYISCNYIMYTCCAMISAAHLKTHPGRTVLISSVDGGVDVEDATKTISGEARPPVLFQSFVPNPWVFHVFFFSMSCFKADVFFFFSSFCFMNSNAVFFWAFVFGLVGGSERWRPFPATASWWWLSSLPYLSINM